MSRINEPLSPITLAQRVQQIREERGMTQSRLAEVANLPLALIQDIESGLELFLSPSMRQKLARALKIRPSALKMLEKPMTETPPTLSAEARDRLTEEILHYPREAYHCPVCGAPLSVRLFHRRDLEDNPLLEVKATCTRCLFRL